MIPCFLNLGTGEIIIIFVVIILLFGAKRIPELARSMGKGISMFKHGMNEAVNQVNEPAADPGKPDGTTPRHTATDDTPSTPDTPAK